MLLCFDELNDVVDILDKHILITKSDEISGVCVQQFGTSSLPSLYEALYTLFQRFSYMLGTVDSVCSVKFHKRYKIFPF